MMPAPSTRAVREFAAVMRGRMAAPGRADKHGSARQTPDPHRPDCNQTDAGLVLVKPAIHALGVSASGDRRLAAAARAAAAGAGGAAAAAPGRSRTAPGRATGGAGTPLRRRGAALG